MTPFTCLKLFLKGRKFVKWNEPKDSLYFQCIFRIREYQILIENEEMLVACFVSVRGNLLSRIEHYESCQELIEELILPMSDNLN